jgi:hypothetical protein
MSVDPVVLASSIVLRLQTLTGDQAGRVCRGHGRGTQRRPDVEHHFWLLGGMDPGAYQTAVAEGTVSRDIPGNHSSFFAPAMDPTLSIGVQAHVVATLSYLAKDPYATSAIQLCAKNLRPALEQWKPRAQGGTLNAFPPLQTLGSPGTMRSPARQLNRAGRGRLAAVVLVVCLLVSLFDNAVRRADTEEP